MLWSLLFRLCDEYELIAERALATPPNTERLMELKAFIDKVSSSVYHDDVTVTNMFGFMYDLM